MAPGEGRGTAEALVVLGHVCMRWVSVASGWGHVTWGLVG